MPRLSQSVPAYRRHKASGKAVVTLNGKDFYLGVFGSPESKTQYDCLIAEYLASNRLHPQAVAASDPAGQVQITIDEDFLQYWEHLQTYYVKHVKPTTEQGLIKLTMRPLRELFGPTPAAKFTIANLTTYRQ